jgi:hypothetical protein
MEITLAPCARLAPVCAGPVERVSPPNDSEFNCGGHLSLRDREVRQVAADRRTIGHNALSSPPIRSQAGAQVKLRHDYRAAGDIYLSARSAGHDNGALL